MNNEEATDTGLHRELKRRWPESAWLVPFLRYLTPALVGAALATIIGWLVYIFNSPQKDIARVQESVTELKQAVGQMLDLQHQSDTRQADLGRQVTDMAKQLDLEQARWVRIDTVAELPPHAARRKR